MAKTIPGNRDLQSFIIRGTNKVVRDKLSLQPNLVGMRVSTQPGHLKVVDNRRSLRVFALFGGGKKDGDKDDGELHTSINSDRHAMKASSSNSKSALKYLAKASKSDNDLLEKPSSNVEEYVNGDDVAEPTQHVDIEPKRAAKIHDFCFGIPYGGIVLSGALVGFLFTRNFSTLMSGGLYGGALLALSMLSLKVWGQGQSSLPFILGQAGIAAALLWKNMHTYSLTKKLLPTGFSIFISAAMLCFYAYVVLSGGNPPPKKLKSAAVASS